MELLMLEKHYSVAEVAEALGVTDRTIRNWIKQGKLSAVSLPGRWGKPTYAIPRSELERLGMRILDEDDK